MPLDHKVAREQWARYVYARDTGHRQFIHKANRCEDYFAGLQWEADVVTELAAQKRPALTINKVLITLSSIMGEQIDLRSETSFKPRYGAPPGNADMLSKVYKFISDDNQLTWTRSEVFADGAITSRGYYDVRLKFDSNVAGEVQISRLNPRMVMPDPDGSEYDPETWNDVITTSWVTADDIELVYGDKEAAKDLRVRSESVWGHSFDSIDLGNDRFGGNAFKGVELTTDQRATMRGIRLVDRQHRELTKVKFIVDTKSGDKMQVPDSWDRDDIAFALGQGPGLQVVDELVKRIKWTCTAEDYVLHDKWSPFRRLTVVPYFPYFRFGRTVGLVEGLIDPQELLNKTLSQELHVVNTMANSGWKVRKGALANMDIQDLEEKGATTGLVIETTGDPEKDVVKIQPNQIPSGLERLSFKAEQYIKTVSGRGDNQLGLQRPDQSGKLAEAANQSSDVSLRKPLDNLERSDWLLAHNILEIVQNFYTDRRILNITGDDLTGEVQEVSINTPDPSSGELVNDLSLGTYDVVITSQNARRTLDENEFAQALELRKYGVQIPDKFIIENSNLRKRGEIVKAMEAEAQSPEAQAKRRVEQLSGALTVAEQKAQVSKAEADATHSRAKAAKTLAETQTEARGEPGEAAEMESKERMHQQEMEHKREKHEMDIQQQREKHAIEMREKQADAAAKRQNERVKTVLAARQAAKSPQPKAQGASA